MSALPASSSWALRIFRFIDGEEAGEQPFHREHFRIYDNTVTDGSHANFGFTISFDENGPSLLTFELGY